MGPLAVSDRVAASHAPDMDRRAAGALRRRPSLPFRPGNVEIRRPIGSLAWSWHSRPSTWWRGVTPIVALRPVGEPMNPRMSRSAVRRPRIVARRPSAACGRALAGHNATIRGTYRSGCLLLRIVALRPTEGRSDAIRPVSAVRWPRIVATCPARGVGELSGGHNATICGTHGSDRRAQDHHGTSRARRSSSVSRRRLSLTCPRSITACAGRSRPL